MTRKQACHNVLSAVLSYIHAQNAWLPTHSGRYTVENEQDRERSREREREREGEGEVGREERERERQSHRHTGRQVGRPKDKRTDAGIRFDWQSDRDV